MNNHKGHVPIRTCVMCRTKKNKKELIRLVLDRDNRIVIDELQKIEGRGIYLCNDISCRNKFTKSKGLNRFFRMDRTVTIGFDLI
jgi:predicted RNA-binding protein YlxR (DUF448 family)